MKKIILLLLIIVAGISCKKEDEGPLYSGEIVLSSEILQSGQDYIFYGFSFSTGQISTYSLTGSSTPDLAAILNINGHEYEVVLSGSEDEEAFHKNGNFGSPEEAEAYYNNYTEVIGNDFQPLAQDIQENEVWTVQTANKHFAKIWIKKISILEGATMDYAEITLKYNYQPDGSRTFDCDCQ